jgi:hypothetical protein
VPTTGPSIEAPTDGMQAIRASLEGRGVLEEAATIIRAAWRPGTEKQYRTYVEKWRAYCQSKQTHLFQTTLAHILDFLLMLFNEGLSLSTINTARSALSFLVNPIDGKSVGEHALVCRFLKGVKRLRPSLPKYKFTWDPTIVINFITNMTHTELKDITHKITMLLALLTAQRAQTLHVLRLGNMTISEEIVHFKITDPLKNREPGEADITLNKFPEDTRLCIVTLLHYYLARTECYRNEEDDRLILTCIHPFRPASVDTIRRYLLTVMEKAGIDVSVFKPHSTRAAATSAAHRNHVPVQTIMNNAMWKTPSTFARFYNKPLVVTEDNVFQRSILQDAVV